MNKFVHLRISSALMNKPTGSAALTVSRPSGRATAIRRQAGILSYTTRQTNRTGCCHSRSAWRSGPEPKPVTSTYSDLQNQLVVCNIGCNIERVNVAGNGAATSLAPCNRMTAKPLIMAAPLLHHPHHLHTLTPCTIEGESAVSTPSGAGLLRMGISTSQLRTGCLPRSVASRPGPPGGTLRASTSG